MFETDYWMIFFTFCSVRKKRKWKLFRKSPNVPPEPQCLCLLHCRNLHLVGRGVGALSSLKTEFFFPSSKSNVHFLWILRTKTGHVIWIIPCSFFPSRSYVFSPWKQKRKKKKGPLWHSSPCLVHSATAAAYLLTQIILLWIVLSSPVAARLMDEQVGQRRKAHLHSALFGTAARSGPQERARSPSG